LGSHAAERLRRAKLSTLQLSPSTADHHPLSKNKKTGGILVPTVDEHLESRDILYVEFWHHML